MIREVFEEVAIVIDQDNVAEVYAGTDYSTQGTHYSLYMEFLLIGVVDFYIQK